MVDARPTAITSRWFAAPRGRGAAAEKGKALARETGAGMLISGRFYRDADTLRFQANVIAWSVWEALWSMLRSVGPLRRRLRFSRILPGGIVALVAQTSDTTSVALSTLSSPPSLDAYTEFKKGLEGFFSRSPSAYGHLLRATELDTTYVTPWVVLAAAAEDRGDRAIMDSALKRANVMTDRMTPVERAIIEYTKAKRTAI